MIKLIAKLVLLTILTLGTAFAGGKNSQPVCWLDFWAQNNTSEMVEVRVECEKGYFWAELAPGECFWYIIDYEVPPNGFSPDWMIRGGPVNAWTNGKQKKRHVKCFANLSAIIVTINQKENGQLKTEFELIE